MWTFKHCQQWFTWKVNRVWILWKQKGWIMEAASDLWHPRDDQRAPLRRRLPSHFGCRLSQLTNGRLCNRIQSIRETAALWATKTQILSSAIINGSDIMLSVWTEGVSVYKWAAGRACLTACAQAAWRSLRSLLLRRSIVLMLRFICCMKSPELTAGVGAASDFWQDDGLLLIHFHFRWRTQRRFTWKGSRGKC